MFNRRSFFSAILGFLSAAYAILLGKPVQAGFGYGVKNNWDWEPYFRPDVEPKLLKVWAITPTLLLEVWQVKGFRFSRYYVRHVKEGTLELVDTTQAIRLLHICPEYRREQAMLLAKAL